MRNLILGATAFALAGLAPLATTTQARAEIEYPYCGYGRQGSGGCMYATLDQCRAFVSGAGGACYNNPRYTANAAGTAGMARSRR